MSNELWHCTMEEKAAMDANLLRVEREKMAQARSAIYERDMRVQAEARVVALELVLAATANNFSGEDGERTAGLCWCGVSWNTEFVHDEHSKSCLIARAALDPIPKEGA